MAIGSIVARILTQYSDKGSKAAAKDITKLGKNFDAFARKATKSFGIAAAASAAFAIKMGIDSVKAAMEDQKGQVILANSLRNTVGATDSAIAAVEEYISKQQLLVNVSDSALRPSLSALLVATNDLTQAQALQAIALDTSAATGKDLQTVSIAIAKATTGNVGALKKLGIPLSDNIVKTKDFAGAMDVLRDSYGGASGALAKTDPLTTLNLAFGEIQETLGFALLPVVKEFANYIITDVLPVVQSWIDLNKDKLATSLTNIAELVVTLGKAVFGFIDYISRNLTVIKIFASLIAGIFIASKVYAFATAIGLLIPILTTFTAAAGSAGIATALLTAGVSAGAATAALGAFLITAGAIGVSFAASSKNADKATKSYKGVQDISSKLGATSNGLNKVVKTNTIVINNNAGAVKKLTAEQLLSLKVQKQLQEQFGTKATSETNPIQLEAARLNLIKQQNLAIQAVDASYLAFIERQMKANENAQRYADILAAIKDGKITTEEVDNLANAWGIPRDAVVAYISKVTGISQEAFAGLDTPGLSAASGWNTAKASLDAYYKALGSFSAVTPPPLTSKEVTAIVESGGFAPIVPGTGGVIGGSSSAGNYASSGFPGSDMTYSGTGGYGGGSNTTIINNYITSNGDPTKAGDSVVDAINSSTNIRGGYQGIGVSRAVTLL
jgi:hypothetical protein